MGIVIVSTKIDNIIETLKAKITAKGGTPTETRIRRLDDSDERVIEVKGIIWEQEIISESDCTDIATTEPQICPDCNAAIYCHAEITSCPNCRRPWSGKKPDLFTDKADAAKELKGLVERGIISLDDIPSDIRALL